jgi:putative phosphoesterase
VFGNNDGEKDGLSNISESKIKAGPLRMELHNKKITLVHDINILDINKEKADVIAFGHTHKPEIVKKYNKLILNPGECGGWLTAQSTVALVDLNSLSGKIFKISILSDMLR